MYAIGLGDGVDPKLVGAATRLLGLRGTAPIHDVASCIQRTPRLRKYSVSVIGIEVCNSMIQVFRKFISIAGRTFGIKHSDLPATMGGSAFDFYHLVKSRITPSGPRFDLVKNALQILVRFKLLQFLKPAECPKPGIALLEPRQSALKSVGNDALNYRDCLTEEALRKAAFNMSAGIFLEHAALWSVSCTFSGFAP